MRNCTITLTFFVLFMLAACATPPRGWVRPDTTAQQFSKDQAECKFEAAKSANQVNSSYRSSFGQELDLVVRRNEIHDLCLKAKGYSLQAL